MDQQDPELRDGRAGGLTAALVWSADCLRHEPLAEVWLGVRTAGTEVAARATAIKSAVLAAGAAVVEATPHDDSVLTQVHDEALLVHLRTIYPAWVDAGLPVNPGADRVVPYVFPTGELLGGLAIREPVATPARAGPEQGERPERQFPATERTGSPRWGTDATGSSEPLLN